MEAIPKIVQFLLAALAFAVLHHNSLPQPLQNLAGVAKERLDVRPYQPLNVITVQRARRALPAVDSVKPAGLLAPVTAVVMVVLPLDPQTRERQPAQAALDEAAQQVRLPSV